MIALAEVVNARLAGRFELANGAWEIDADPDVMMRLKRIFPRCASTFTGTIKLAATAEVAAELAWVLKRWPMDASDADRACLLAAAAEHERTEALVAQILAGRSPVQPHPDWVQSTVALRDYQRQVRDLVWANSGTLAVHDLGIGKTLTSLSVLENPDARPAVAVTYAGRMPKQWRKQLAKFYPDLKCLELRNGDKQTLEVDGQFPDLITMNYHKLNKWQHELKSVVKTVIFDEVQELRRKDSDKYTAARAVASNAKYVIGLSGTPIYNYGAEAYYVIDAIKPGALGTEEEFARQWCGTTSLPSCRRVVIPPLTPSLAALDLTDLGVRIGDRTKPLAAATMARAERCRQRFADFPAVLMPAKALRGSERHPWQPLTTQTSQQEAAVLSTGAIMTAAGNTYERPGSQCRSRTLAEPLWSQTATNTTGVITPPVAVAVDNYQGSPRGVDEPLPTQVGSETLGLLSARALPSRTSATNRGLNGLMETLVAGAGSGVLGVLSSGVIPYRRNTVPATHAEAMPTVTSDQIPGLLTAAGRVQINGSIDEAKYRSYPLDKPLGTVVGSAITQGVLFSGWYKQNGSLGSETAPHPVTDALGTLTSRDTTALLTAQWHSMLADLSLEDCYFRMMSAHEVGRGCGFDVDFAGYSGTFVVWGSARNQVDGYGNAVSPPVGEWIGTRLRAILHSVEAAA
ncbi:hypothetical protein JF729_07200 [Mycobacterium intracellulare]|uniref:SNF2-related protein n=1 Tax=Mycobacterium intracellulare TaxID=1767 RepID=UPI001CD9A445|nr:SNF2-related protein [Mycobacterium intracellulare]MCA2247583.1 hypothetical protein [Mycobacterium intracellulare]